MRVITLWQTFAHLHPVSVVVALTAVFTAYTLGVSWLADVVYYSRPAPGALVGATLALNLAAAFVVGFCTPLRSVTFAPALGHVASVFLWPLSPWGSFGNLTYDIGWAGVAVYTLLQCFVLWLVAFVGWSWQTGSKK